jgi:putative aldouronate transport system permease protein
MESGVFGLAALSVVGICTMRWHTAAGVDPAYYEAAIVDGAGHWQRIRHITLPLLMPTILILVLLAIGRIFYGDFAMIYGIIGDNGLLFSTTDVIDTYVFRALRQMNDFGMSAAAGLYQSVFGFIVILSSNYLVKKYNEEASLF